MQPPNDPPASRQRWVSMPEAVRILGLPESTIRRLIRQERLTGEQIARDPDNPRDTRRVWQVLVTDPPAPATAIESVQAPGTRQEPPQAATDVSALLEAAMAPVTEMLALERAERQRLANEIVAETARRAAAETRATMLQAELDRERRPWWRKVLDLPPA